MSRGRAGRWSRAAAASAPASVPVAPIEVPAHRCPCCGGSHSSTLDGPTARALAAQPEEVATVLRTCPATGTRYQVRMRVADARPA